VTFEDLLKEIIDSGSEKAAAEWLESIKEEYGIVPLIFQRMAERPEVLLSHLLYKGTVVETSSLEPKMVELISLAVSAALNCNHCVQYHIRAAVRKGATREEILEVILIAGSLAQATVLADAYRVMDKETPCEASCDVNGVKLKNGKGH
jgi:AhpD family alkylhydroperoxidase